MRESYISAKGIVPINFSHIAVAASPETGVISADANRFKIKPAYLLNKKDTLSSVVFSKPLFMFGDKNERHVYSLLELFGIMWMGEIYDALHDASIIHVQHSILGNAIRKSSLDAVVDLVYYPHSLSNAQDETRVSVSALNAYVHTIEVWSILNDEGAPSLRIVITPNPEWAMRYNVQEMDFEFVIPHSVIDGLYASGFKSTPFFNPPDVDNNDSLMARYVTAANFHKYRFPRNVDFSGISTPI